MALGIAYYAGTAVAAWLGQPALCTAALGAAVLALGASVYLAYRLHSTLRMACPFCWTAHGVNGALALLLAFRCFMFE